MDRREFLKFSSCGLTMVAVGSTMPLLMKANPAFAQSSSSSRLELDMVEVFAEMVDEVQVPMWAFKVNSDDNGDSSSSDSLIGSPRIPGPALFVMEGERVRLRVRNRIPNGGPHAFAIPGVVETPPMELDDREDVDFIAPKAGTYVYLDPLNAPVNRVMGLHGVLVVLPNPVGQHTPYSDPTPRIQQLFDDLGATAHFPGHPWDPVRNAVWVFNTIDPVKNIAAAASTGGITPAAFLSGYLPQYFTINGKSGFFGAQHGHDHDSGGEDHSHEDLLDRFTFDIQANISIKGRVGQPVLIRNVNAGLMWHSPHIHGNHVYPLGRANYLSGARTLSNNLLMVDTWTMAPGDVRDVLHPYIAPPDIPPNFWELAAEGLNQEKFPLLYPMHDHNEISNTAAGANYPHGLATHWQIDGDIDPLAAVIQVEKAEYRVRTGQIMLEGLSSTASVEFEIHAGGLDGPHIGHIHVHGNGHWSFTGRSLKVLAERRVTIVFHDEADHSQIHSYATVPLRFR